MKSFCQLQFNAGLLAVLLLSQLAEAQVTIPRGRPQLNPARTTFVADNGRLLRGPYESTEWTTAAPAANVAKMKELGFNAVHLYAEVFDPNYPNPGSTTPGYAVTEVDKMVAITRTNGLYLVMTIGNGANNGNYNAAYVTNFWNFYAPRYANETHVIYEVQNEPVAWGPPYSSPSANPPGALDMEVAAYQSIRAGAPHSPVLLFSYAVLGDTGGAANALTDIRAFNQAVFGNQNAVWTNIAVGFHGYAGASAFEIAVSSILSAGYPCFQTEFGAGTWGGGPGGLDVEGVAILERLGVSWLAFAYIPPSGVSDDVTKPEVYSNRVVNAGLSWTPDFGSFPVVRGVFGNNGYPWTTPNYVNNALSGALRIQMEDFDNGGKGVAYYNGNSSNPGGQYRTSETVGIEVTADSGGGYDVGWTAVGDWLEYTVKISQAGTYNLRLRIAGTNSGRVRFIANGADLTGEWTLPNTGGAQAWQTVSRSVFLAPGQQKLHLDVLAGGCNLNWMELSPAGSGPIPNGTYKILNAASGMALDLSANNHVITNAYAGSNTQHWNLYHIGGGQYRVSSAAKGNSWYAWAGPLRLLPWGWGAGGDTCYIFRPTGGGYYRFCTAGGGTSFAPSADNPPELDDGIYTGAAQQQWAILSPSAPAFPVGLSAVLVAPNQADLTWNAVSGATSYHVKRSTTSGGAYATIATGVTAANYTDTSLSSGVQYYYVVSAVSAGVESANSAEAALGFPRLAGAIIGTAGSWNNSGNTILKAFDNDLNTFFDAPIGNGAWVGLNFGVGVSNVITQINYCPRSGFASRMVGGIFQGANLANFSDAVTLGTVTTQPASGGFTSVSVTQSNAFRYVRYLAPDNGWGNVAELEFYGYPYSPPVPVPSGLSAVAVSASQINLNWYALPGATSYTVKRSMISDGPYVAVASGVTGTSYQDNGLPGGAICFYVVSAVVDGRETPDSLQVAAATQLPPDDSLIHRYAFLETGGATVADLAGGPPWTATLPNDGWLAGGNMVLSSASQQYLSLPSGIVSSLSNLTIMAWVNLASSSGWSRIFDFGNNTTTNMFLTPQNGITGTLRFAITTNGAGSEQQINCSSTVSLGEWHQVAVSLSGRVGNLYLDGVAVGMNANMTLNPQSMGSTAQNYIGKSQYADPYLDGSIDEFRIYGVALSPAEIAATAALGPGRVLSTSSPVLEVTPTGTDLTFSWPLANAGFMLQTCTNLPPAVWMNITSPAPQIVGDQWRIILPRSTGAGPTFYRLAH